MTLITVPIQIVDPCTLLENFQFIEVWRAATKYGSYSRITTTATRIQICPEKQQYEYVDKTASEFSWYKYRAADSAQSNFGPYSAPFQASNPNTTYCTLEDVQRILGRGEDAKRIRFSDAYKNLQPMKTNTGSKKLAAISLGPSYCGIERIVIEFTTTTAFKIVTTELQRVETRIIGTGDVSADFAAADGSIFIKSSDWSGTAAIGDKIEFETFSHMSTNDAIAFIQDAEIFVDMVLEENLQFTDSKDTEIRFDSRTVPKAVRAATSRIAAFFIYSTVYNEQAISGIPGANINDITAGYRRPDDFSSWPRQAMRYLQGWIVKSQKYFDPETGEAMASGPRWRSVGAFFEGQGVYGVGSGMKLPELNTFNDRSQMNYDGILDYDLLGMNENQWNVE
jgi:hypothetical protein